MKYLVYGLAPHSEARLDVSLRRSGVIPGTGSRRATGRNPGSTSFIARVRTVLSVSRRRGGRPSPGSRATAGSGVSPIASGASRGLTFLVGR